MSNVDAANAKINNDVFIPRSILKRSNVPGSIKEQRLEAAAEEFFEYQLAIHKMKKETSEEYLGKYEVVFGQQLQNNNPLLSPKFKDIIQEGYNEHIMMQEKLDKNANASNAILNKMNENINIIPQAPINLLPSHASNGTSEEVI